MNSCWGHLRQSTETNKWRTWMSADPTQHGSGIFSRKSILSLCLPLWPVLKRCRVTQIYALWWSAWSLHLFLIHAGRPPEPSHVACSSTIFWKHLVLSREFFGNGRYFLDSTLSRFAIFHLSLSLHSPSPVVMGWTYNNCGFAGITSDHLSGSSSHFWGTHVPSTSSFD